METVLALTRVSQTNVMAVRGDLTRQPVEAVVNAANENLQHGGGVAKAIVSTGGRVIQEESDAWVRRYGPVGPGQAAVTTGGMLIASHVIHVVGPRYAAGQDNAGLLQAATVAALDAAVLHDLKSLAMPAISAGIFGYPPEDATAVIVAAVVDWLETTPNDLGEIRLVGFSKAVAEMFAASLTAATASSDQSSG